MIINEDSSTSGVPGKPLKILQLCHRVPYPPVDGGNIVMMNLALGLASIGHNVTQFSLNTRKHYVEPETVPSSITGKIRIEAETIDTTVTVSGALRNVFGKGSYNVQRFHSQQAEEKLRKLLQENEFDIVQLETLFAAPYIPCIRQHTHAKIVLRAHNVEHIIWQRLAAASRNPFKKSYLRFLSKRLQNYEYQVLGEIDALVPITPVDESHFLSVGFRKPILTLPMSLDMADYAFDPGAKPELSLFHLGSMDWMPNLEGVKWFLNYCWPGIHRKHPELRLYLAGRGFPDEIRNMNLPNVICEGMIENGLEYMRGKQIMIVPLHSGSGMRVKIIQGLALGRTIISTTIGAEGISVENGKNILIADTAQHFIDTVNRCMENPEWCRNIGKSGRKFVEATYSNAAIAGQLSVFYRALLHC